MLKHLQENGIKPAAMATAARPQSGARSAARPRLPVVSENRTSRRERPPAQLRPGSSLPVRHCRIWHGFNGQPR